MSYISLSSSTSSIEQETIFGPNCSYVDFKIIPLVRIHIVDICSTDSKKIETGTELIRKVVERAFRENLAVTAHVERSSHIFYLKMGMVPDKFSLSYVAWKYGKNGYLALKALKESDPDAAQLNELKAILGNEEGRTEILDGEVFEKKAFLLELLERQCDPPFIQSLLAVLKRPDQDPDTADLDPLRMRLSEMGCLRWKEAIGTNTPFKPFRNFEHLDMAPEQRQELAEILKKSN